MKSDDSEFEGKYTIEVTATLKGVSQITLKKEFDLTLISPLTGIDEPITVVDF